MGILITGISVIIPHHLSPGPLHVMPRQRVRVHRFCADPLSTIWDILNGGGCGPAFMRYSNSNARWRDPNRIPVLKRSISAPDATPPLQIRIWRGGGSDFEYFGYFESPRAHIQNIQNIQNRSRRPPPIRSNSGKEGGGETDSKYSKYSKYSKLMVGFNVGRPRRAQIQF